MSTSRRKLRVFLCHSSQDKPIVRELYWQLSTEDWIEPWLDEEKLLPGQEWDLEIEKAVEAADVVIVCLSNNSVNKEGYVQREIRFVLDIALTKPDETIFVIPLRLEDCQPPRRLRGWQYADYFPPERRQWSYQRLQKSLKIRLEQENSSDLLGSIRMDNEKAKNTKVSQTEELILEETTKNITHENTATESAPSMSNDQLSPADYQLSTLSVETLGGVSTPIYHKGEPLPFKNSVTFSTASDNQNQVEIHLILGENNLAKDNVSLEKFIFDGLSPAPKGVPQIEIQIEISEDFSLSIIVIDKSTERFKRFDTIALENISPPLVTDPIHPKPTSGPSDYTADFSDIFEELFGKGFGFSADKRKNPDISLKLTITSTEAKFGAIREVEYQREENCSDCSGSGAEPGTSTSSRCSKCNRQGEIRGVKQTFLGQMVQTSVCPSCNGQGYLISSPCKNCKGKGKFLRKHHVKVKIPPNTLADSIIKLSGVGNASREGGTRGDVLVNVVIE
jgi:hypothetical protein